MAKCGRECEIWSRPCGYFRPVSNWNRGKKQEFKDRKNYIIPPLTNQEQGHEVTIKPASRGKENNYDGKHE
jgi:ribonucleoside-triphosphate reductase